MTDVEYEDNAFTCPECGAHVPGYELHESTNSYHRPFCSLYGPEEWDDEQER